jgi:hypothetical protein
VRRLLSPAWFWVKRSGLLFVVLVSCSHAQYRPDQTPHDVCALLDSLYSRAVLPVPYSLNGKARFDVNQYRLRGQFVLTVETAEETAAVSDSANGSGMTGAPATRKAFDFISSSYFGSHREDVTITMIGDATWILDRERDAYYQGEDADRFIRDRLSISGDFSRVIDLATGSAPDCGVLEDATAERTGGGDLVICGSVGGEPAKFIFSARSRKLKEINWPFEVEPQTIERLRITYEWSNGGEALESIQLMLEKFRWQIKLDVTQTIEY